MSSKNGPPSGLFWGIIKKGEWSLTTKDPAEKAIKSAEN